MMSFNTTPSSTFIIWFSEQHFLLYLFIYLYQWALVVSYLVPSVIISHCHYFDTLRYQFGQWKQPLLGSFFYNISIISRASFNFLTKQDISGSSYSFLYLSPRSNNLQGYLLSYLESHIWKASGDKMSSLWLDCHLSQALSVQTARKYMYVHVYMYFFIYACMPITTNIYQYFEFHC